MPIEGSHYFQRHKNPVISLWHLWKNNIKMLRIKISPTLIFLLGLFVLLFGYLIFMAIEAEFSRSNSLGEIIGKSFIIIFFVPVLLFVIDLFVYLFLLRSSFIYQLLGLEISDEGINFKFKNNDEFIDYHRINKLNFNPYGAVIGGLIGPNYLIRSFFSFRMFYNIELKDMNGKIKNIAIPLDIEKVDKAIGIISSKLEKNKVNIGFFEGKPTTAYIPGVTRPEFSHEPIGKWVLLISVIFILIIWLITKFFL